MAAPFMQPYVRMIKSTVYNALRMGDDSFNFQLLAISVTIFELFLCHDMHCNFGEEGTMTLDKEVSEVVNDQWSRGIVIRTMCEHSCGQKIIPTRVEGGKARMGNDSGVNEVQRTVGFANYRQTTTMQLLVLQVPVL